MCGRYTLTSQDGLAEELEAAVDPGAPQNAWWKPRFNVAPTQDAPVVMQRHGGRVLEMMRWGLVPFWAPGKHAPLMINARAESVDGKAMFRDALARKRCLVPADGFFEWAHRGKKQAQPLWFHPEPRRVIAFAGLWARAKTEAGELHSFTIITGPANELVAPVHDRMPIVLPREAWAAWLDPAQGAEHARALLGAPPAAGWRAQPVSSWVNKADHDDARCLEPPSQGDLF